MIYPAFLFLVVVTFVLSGCGGAPTSSSVNTVFVEQQLLASRAELDRGNLAPALAYLRSVQTLQPDNSAITEEIQSLTERIDAEYARAIARGKRAYARGDNRRGDRWMLDALALKPGDESALARLRQSTSLASHARQAEKVAAEFAARSETEERQAVSGIEEAYNRGDYQAVLTAATLSPMADSDSIRDLRRRANVGLADRAQAARDRDAELQHLLAAISLSRGSERRALESRARALRETLSDEAYREGLGQIKTDLAAAIAYFKQAAAYDPSNMLAKEKLDQARTLKKNLERIQGN